MTGRVLDRRLTPANGRVAHESLRGIIKAERFVDGRPARIARPLVDLLARPDGARDRQLLFGERVLVLDETHRHAFVRADKDGYCGWIDAAALVADHAVTHRLVAPAGHFYVTPSIKRREAFLLSFGALLLIAGVEGAFAVTEEGFYIPQVHVAPLSERGDDPASIASMFLGTPYLWGGNSRDGMDCSGLVQAALLACGIACPGDSDLQFADVGRSVSGDAPLRRNDLIFWKGHVALALDAGRIIHANAAAMSVTIEGFEAAKARIEKAGGADVFLGVKRI